MGLETFTGAVSALVPTNPTSGDPEAQGDDHIRGVKKTIIEGVIAKTGGTLTGQLKGITPVAIDDLTRKDYVDSAITAAINAAIATTKSNTQCFSARLSGNQTVVSGAATKVNLNVEDFDTAGVFTTGRFTPTVAGYYQINATVCGSSTTITNLNGQIVKNGAAVVTATDTAAATSGAWRVGLSCIVAMNGSTDYIELAGSVTGGSPAFDGTAGALGCTMSGSFLRAL